MTFIITPYVIISVITANVAFIALIMAWRRRTMPGATSLMMLLGAVALWAGGAAFEYAVTDIQGKMFWAGLEYGGVVGCPVCFLFFALEYCRLEHWLTRRNIALVLIVPLITWGLALTNGWHGLIWPSITLSSDGYNLAIYGHGVWYWIGAVGYGYLMMLVGTVLLVRTALYFPHSYRRQAGMIVVGALAPWVVNVIYVAGFSPLPGLELTPLAMTLTGITFVWNILRFGLLDLAPVARDALIEKMADGMLVLDKQERVVDINPAAQRLVGAAQKISLGQPAREVFVTWLDWEKRFHEMLETRFEIASDETPPRYLELGISSIYDHRGRNTGRLIVMHDITERKQSEEKLRELSLVDELTCLNNRRGFTLLANHQIKTTDRLNQKAILIFADIDDMKSINDNLGHHEGDRALVDAANILKSSFRVSDIIARWGGDEFVIFAIETQESSSVIITARLEEQLNAFYLRQNRPYRLSISLGLAHYDPRKPCSLEELLEQADKAMYDDKLAKKCAVRGDSGINNGALESNSDA